MVTNSVESHFYEGTVAHERDGEVVHDFNVPLYMVYLNLGDLPDVFDGIWGWTVESPGLVQFRRSDHFGDPGRSLERTVRDFVERERGDRPEGSIALLTQLRTFGYLFNPVSFYYCRGDEGALHTVLAEVHNTPWNEEYLYTIPADGAGESLNHAEAKDFHVSPFQPMDRRYEFTLTEPSEDLHVSVGSYEGSKRKFWASLDMERRPLTASTAYEMMVRHPFMTFRIIAGIYVQALRLWMKGATFYSHPERIES